MIEKLCQIFLGHPALEKERRYPILYLLKCRSILRVGPLMFSFVLLHFVDHVQGVWTGDGLIAGGLLLDEC